MDTLNLISNLYKQELADADEQKILFKAQCEIYKQQIEQLEQQLKEANNKITDLEAKKDDIEIVAEAYEPVEHPDSDVF